MWKKRRTCLCCLHRRTTRKATTTIKTMMMTQAQATNAAIIRGLGEMLSARSVSTHQTKKNHQHSYKFSSLQSLITSVISWFYSILLCSVNQSIIQLNQSIEVNFYSAKSKYHLYSATSRTLHLQRRCTSQREPTYSPGRSIIMVKLASYYYLFSNNVNVSYWFFTFTFLSLFL